jgi:hypothetical protein
MLFCALEVIAMGVGLTVILLMPNSSYFWAQTLFAVAYYWIAKFALLKVAACLEAGGFTIFEKSVNGAPPNNLLDR